MIARVLQYLLPAVLALALPCLAAEKADLVVVDKSEHRLTLYRGQDIIGSFHVVFGPQPIGPKQQAGDERTPEGHYMLDYKKVDSDFHKAIHISYPNDTDIANAEKNHVLPGGNIMIHGQYKGSRKPAEITQLYNWTNGCIALTNEDMDKVWTAVDPGTAIDINP